MKIVNNKKLWFKMILFIVITIMMFLVSTINIFAKEQTSTDNAETDGNLIEAIIPSSSAITINNKNFKKLVNKIIIPSDEILKLIEEEIETEEFLEDPLAGYEYIGNFKITWYAWELVGNNNGARGVEGGMIPGYSCAVPEQWMLGKYIYVDGYGFFRADDISPKGIIDLFVTSVSDIPSYGQDFKDVYAK